MIGSDVLPRPDHARNEAGLEPPIYDGIAGPVDGIDGGLGGLVNGPVPGVPIGKLLFDPP